jgi:hypothetical protein
MGEAITRRSLRPLRFYEGHFPQHSGAVCAAGMRCRVFRHCERSAAIQKPATTKILDCFVARAPRNNDTLFDTQIRTTAATPHRLLRAAQLAGRGAGRGDAALALLANGDALIEHFRIVAGNDVSRARVIGARGIVRLVPLIAGGDHEGHGNHKSQSSHDASLALSCRMSRFAPTLRSIKRSNLTYFMARRFFCRRP